MVGSTLLSRWIDLAAALLTGTGGRPPLAIALAELVRQLDSLVGGAVDFRTGSVDVQPYVPGEIPADRAVPAPEPYVAQIADHALARYFVQTGDPRPASTTEGRRFYGDPKVLRLMESARDDGIAESLFVPLTPRSDFAHRWLVVAGGAPLRESAKDLASTLLPLLAAIDAQARVVDRLHPGDPSSTRTTLDLTGRELAVLALMARGLTAVSIGRRLNLSPRTVSKHQGNVYRKLDVRDRLAAVLIAQQLGILPMPPPGLAAAMSSRGARELPRQASPSSPR